MPIIVNAKEPHPLFPSLSDTSVIEAERARRQDVRVLKIAFINFMAEKPSTEQQLGYWLGQSKLQVDLTLVSTDEYLGKVRNGYEPGQTPRNHLLNFYKPFGAIKREKFDGLLVTGFNAQKSFVAQENFWSAMQEIFEWSKTNVFSSCFLCYGAKAALKHFHDIESYKASEKYFGLYEHHIVKDSTSMLSHMQDEFFLPVSRWKTPRKEDILDCKALEVVAEAKDIGPSIMAEAVPYDNGKRLYPKRLYVLPHPEYPTDRLKDEYARDVEKNPTTPLPKNYDVKNPRNTWRPAGLIYRNWVDAIYDAAPRRTADIPSPMKSRLALTK